MGNVVGKQFGVVASKDYNTALTESVKEGNQGKFYLTENGGNGFDNITAATDDSRNTLIVNGNKIQGVSTSDINKLNTIGSAITDSGFFNYKTGVEYFSQLPNSNDNVSVGDVYTIYNDFVLDGNKYPSWTNVVCIDTSADSFTPIKWTALGSIMTIGTFANSMRSNEQEIDYYTVNDVPISRFSLHLSSGLRSDDGISISLRLSTSSRGNAQVTDISGLDISDSGIRLALATGYNQTFINGLITIGTDEAEKGGLSIYGPAIEDYLKESSYNDYINSLIDSKLVIQ